MLVVAGLTNPLVYPMCRAIVKIPLVCMAELDNFLSADRLQGRRAFCGLPHCIENHKMNVRALICIEPML